MKGTGPEALLLLWVNLRHCISAQSRRVLCISSDDSVDPGQVRGNLHIDSVIVPAAALIIGKDPCSVNVPSFRICDSQCTSCIPKTNISLKAGRSHAEHVVVYIWCERNTWIFCLTERVTSQGQYQVFQWCSRGEGSPPAPASDDSWLSHGVFQALISLWQWDGGDFIAHNHSLLQLDQSQVIIPVWSVLEARMENNLQTNKKKSDLQTYFNVKWFLKTF